MKNLLLDGTIVTMQELAEKFRDIMQQIVGPVMIVIGAAAVAYLIYLGILYAKSEDANKRKEVQGRLIGAVIGAVIIVAGITLVYAINWAEIYKAFGATASIGL